MCNCPRCKQEATMLIDAPPGAPWEKTCKSCSRFIWNQYDRQAGLDIPAGKNKADVKHRYEPTERHERIAMIAAVRLGDNVTKEDVKTIFEATRIEHKERTGKVAAGR